MLMYFLYSCLKMDARYKREWVQVADMPFGRSHFAAAGVKNREGKWARQQIIHSLLLCH